MKEYEGRKFQGPSEVTPGQDTKDLNTLEEERLKKKELQTIEKIAYKNLSNILNSRKHILMNISDFKSSIKMDEEQWKGVPFVKAV